MGGRAGVLPKADPCVPNCCWGNVYRLDLEMAVFSRCQHDLRQLSVVDDFFPAWLQSVWVLRVAFVSTTAALAFSGVTASDLARARLVWITLLGSTVLVIHQGSYNDMTFATAWWCSVWLLWLASRINVVRQASHGDQERMHTCLMWRAAFLSRLILSMILLGGAIGKWTSEYWSGQVLYEIYFVDRDFWLFNWLRTTFDQSTLREIATVYSRKVILIETVAGFGLWLLPARYAAVSGIVIFSSIALLSNFLLFSVLLSLIGLAAIGLLANRAASI